MLEYPTSWPEGSDERVREGATPLPELRHRREYFHFVFIHEYS